MGPDGTQSVKARMEMEASKRQSKDCPFVPIGENVILEMIEQSKQRGLIHIPDSAVDAPQYAIVLALGDMVVADIEVGDEVSFGKYSGNILKRDNKEYLVIQADDILAKVRRE